MPKPLVALRIVAHLLDPTGRVLWARDGSYLSMVIAIASFVAISLFIALTNRIARLTFFALLRLASSLGKLLWSMIESLSSTQGDFQAGEEGEDREAVLEGVMYTDVTGSVMMRVKKGGKMIVVCLCPGEIDPLTEDGPESPESAPTPMSSPVSSVIPDASGVLPDSPFIEEPIDEPSAPPKPKPVLRLPRPASRAPHRFAVLPGAPLIPHMPPIPSFRHLTHRHRAEMKTSTHQSTGDSISVPGPFAIRPASVTVPHTAPAPVSEELLIHLDGEEQGGATYTHTGRISSYRRWQLEVGDAIPTAIVDKITSKGPHILSPTYSVGSSLYSTDDEEDEPRTTGRLAQLPWVPPAASTSFVPRVLTLNHGADSDEEEGPTDRDSVSSELSHDSFDFEWAFEAQDAERRAAAESSVPLTPARASTSTSPCVLTRPNSVGNALDAVLQEVNEKLSEA